MTTPYWGQLPEPKVVRGNSLRREAKKGNNDLVIDTNMAGERGSGQFAAQASSKQNNRYSAQTNQTTSTNSPFASPIASDFRGEGLVPRPPSFQADTFAPVYNKEALERRRRRESRNREDVSHNEQEAFLPAAPDAPRAPPPSSYKDPYSNGASSASYQAPARSRSTRKSEGPLTSRKGPSESYSKEEASAPSAFEDPDRLGRVESTNGKGRHNDNHQQSQSRKGSLTEAEAQRRREWASDRSPLQRLELTLDSITKEEKRARVEEAEQLVRESKSSQSGGKPTQNSVRFRNRPVVKGSEAGSHQQGQNTPNTTLARAQSLKQKDQSPRSGADENPRPSNLGSSSVNNKASNYQERKESIDEPRKAATATTSKRGSSLRDRSFIPIATASTGAASGLARSGSNKLRKDPPGDPWLHKRVEAEKKYPEVIVPRKISLNRTPETSPSTTTPSKETAFRSHPQNLKDKELPNLPRRSDQDFDDLDVEDDVDTKPIRRGTLSKIEQLTGHKAPIPSTSTPRTDKGIRTERVKVNGVHFNVSSNISDAVPTTHGPHQNKQAHHRLTDILHHKHADPNETGIYTTPLRLDEWKKGGVALLSGGLLDLGVTEKTEAEKDKAWWEAGNNTRRRSSVKQRKAEAYDGEYDDNSAPTRFKPPLFLRSGPMLRYCGLRKEKVKNRSTRNGVLPDREIWRGSIMIVTRDADSSYELAPTLRLFLQPTDLLPPPPSQLDGQELAPEYIDPLAGLPKMGRDGRTLYIRPVHDLREEADLSREESDDGLFEMKRSLVDLAADQNPATRRPQHDGEKAGKYKEVRGFRLHAERGVTFWRFNIEIELRDRQQRIAYRINRGPATGFWVPPSGQAMNIMFHSCNGFSHAVDSNKFCGPDPMWRDVLNTHQTQPFHVMLGGGDQIYNDKVVDEVKLFQDWMEIDNPLHKKSFPFTNELQNQLEEFYLKRYCMWFSQGLFGLAVSQIPMINIFDDHDIIDGFGSYPDGYMESPVFSGLGMVAFKYYMLFQHQSSIDEGEETEPSWLLGTQPGPFIQELSRSVFTHLGRSIAFLGLDCRTERMNDEVVSVETYDKVFDRLDREIIKGETKHLIVLLGVPVAYPRMVWLENILTSKAIAPLKALSRAGILGKGLLNRLDGGVEILDDLDDHWTAKHHKKERNSFIHQLQDIAAEKSVRITILGGDVHLAAVGQFYSNPKLGISKDRDFRYMPNIISSAIVNASPPDALADLLNKRNKVHHLDAETDEDMIPIFVQDVNGKPRNNKRLLNRRNWCSIQMYNPELSPPPTPEDDRSPSPPKGGLLRRLSASKGPNYRPDAATPQGGLWGLRRRGSDAPPISNVGFFARRVSTDAPPVSNAGFFGRRGSTDAPPLSNPGFFGRRDSTSRHDSSDSQRPGVLSRTLSLTRKDFMPTGLFQRKNKRRSDSGGINGYGDSEDDMSFEDEALRSGLRGGSGGPDEDNDGYFPSIPAPNGRSAEVSHEHMITSVAGAPPVRNPFKRVPTGLSEKKMKKGGNFEINLENGLEVRLNVEISSKDPAGATYPYRFIVPALWYEEEDEDNERLEAPPPQRRPSVIQRITTFTKGKGKERAIGHNEEATYSYSSDEERI